MYGTVSEMFEKGKVQSLMKKAIPVIIAILLIVVIGAVTLAGMLMEKYEKISRPKLSVPNKCRMEGAANFSAADISVVL